MEDIKVRLDEKASVEKVEEKAKGPEQSGPTSYALTMLMALQGKKMYLGTVPWHVKQQRRKRNKAAKQARKANR